MKFTAVLILYQLSDAITTISDLHKLLSYLNQRGIRLMVIKQNIDTKENHLKSNLLIEVLDGLLFFEAEMIHENALASKENRRISGKFGGQKQSVNQKSIKSALSNYVKNKLTIKEIY